MRFSLKWLLVGTAYAVVAAAALTQDSWILADIVWTLSLVAFAFAVVVACLARGPRQAVALGFVAFSGCYLACLQFAESSVPTERLLLDWRFGEWAHISPQVGQDERASIRAKALELQIRQRALMVSNQPFPEIAAYLRTGHAVATMTFGLLGCLLAPLALKAVKPATPTTGA
jgi:hypothetical protein